MMIISFLKFENNIPLKRFSFKDLFTSCLTTPIKMALRWFVMQNQGKLSMKITLDMIDKIPGDK